LRTLSVPSVAPAGAGPIVPCPTASGPGTQALAEALARPADLAPQTAGRCRIESEIARGGMGVVYRALDPFFGRRLAVKILLARAGQHPDLARRFLDEARLTRHLQHPGIPPVHDQGVLDDGRPYFTMKLIQGRTLAALLKERSDPRDDLARFVTVFGQVCQTVAYAHSQGVIHRDLKPSNIMVGAFGEVQVMDWGLAKILREGSAGGGHTPAQPASILPDPRSLDSSPLPPDESQTRTGTFLGTPAYIAPEQARGELELIDARADVFGLGAILCEILTGRPPFLGRGAEATLKAQKGLLEEAHARLEGCGADAELIRLARRCLAAEPRDRPADAGQVAAEVTAYQHAVAERLHQAELQRAAADARAAEEARTRLMAEGKAAEERKRRRMTVALAASLLLSVLVGGGGWLWLRQQQEARTAEATRQVDQALAEARLLRGQAEGDGNPTRWAEALAAAKQAVALATNADTPDLVRQRVGALLAEIEGSARTARERADRVARDRRLIERLLEIRSAAGDQLSGPNQDFPGTDTHYARAFRDYGIDVDALSARAVRDWLAKLGDGVRVELAACLDDWAHARRIPEKYDGARRLSAVAQLLDPDPLRNRVRKAIDGHDLAALQGLARRPEIRTAPLPTVNLLAVYLGIWGDVPGAVTLLRATALRHPGDFQLNHNLAWFLLYRSQPSQPAEALRFSTAAIAARPRSMVARNVLAEACAAIGKVDEGVAVWHTFAEAEPQAARYRCMGNYCFSHSRPAQAAAALRRAVALGCNDSDTLASLAHALNGLGDVAGAIAACRQAMTADPANVGNGKRTTSLLAFVGRLDLALEAWAKYLERGPTDPEAWYGYAELCLYLGLREEYQRTCRELLKRFGKTNQVHFAERFGRTCLLLPGSEEQIAQAAALTDRAVAAGPEHPFYDFFRFAKALADYRQGRHEKALAVLRQLARPRGWAPARLLFATALFRCGHKDEARTALDDAIRESQWAEIFAYDVDAWLAHILRREAEDLMVPNLTAFFQGTYQPRDSGERFSLPGVVSPAAALRRRGQTVRGRLPGGPDARPEPGTRVPLQRGPRRGARRHRTGRPGAAARQRRGGPLAPASPRLAAARPYRVGQAGDERHPARAAGGAQGAAGVEGGPGPGRGVQRGGVGEPPRRRARRVGAAVGRGGRLAQEKGRGRHEVAGCRRGVDGIIRQYWCYPAVAAVLSCTDRK
jgi:serine/threonine-protein kinase